MAHNTAKKGAAKPAPKAKASFVTVRVGKTELAAMARAQRRGKDASRGAMLLRLVLEENKRASRKLGRARRAPKGEAESRCEDRMGSDEECDYGRLF